MPKKQKDLQDLELVKFRKTYGDTIVIPTIDMARLLESKDHPYQHKSRLYRESTNSAIKALKEVSDIFQKVPESYKIEIMEEMLRQEKIRTISNFDSIAFDHHAQKLLNAIQGMRAMMPQKFFEALGLQLTPFLSTMQAISDYANADKGRSKVPSFVVPVDLWRT